MTLPWASRPDAFNPVPSPWRRTRVSAIAGRPLPPSLFVLAWRLGRTDQVYLCVLSAVVAALQTVPIDLQRRIVNQATRDEGLRAIVLLALAYAGVVALQGSVKLLFNVYRSWVSEHAVRVLRSYVANAAHPGTQGGSDEQGTRVAMIIAESEPVGSFVGESVSEPLLQTGVMVAVVGYLVWLQPVITIVLVAVYLPQVVVVPMIQRAINARAQERIAVLRKASAGVIADDPAVAATQDARFDRVFALNFGIFELKYTMRFVMNLCHQLGIAAILGLGGWFVLRGRTEIGTVVAFISGLNTVKDPWTDIATWFQTWQVSAARYDMLRTGLRGGPPPPAG